MITLENLTVRFKEKIVFENKTFSLPDEGIVLLTGESGIGKTTLLRVICGLLKPDAGTVKGLDGRKISFVFQEPRLLGHLTALENVSLVSDPNTALRLLTALNMEQERNELCDHLSGGQKQRVSLARAFAFSDDIVLLDEPFTGLDEENRKRAADLIKTARLAIVVTHDPSDAELLHTNTKILL